LRARFRAQGRDASIRDHHGFGGARNGTVTPGSPIAKNAAQIRGGSPA
jgi:hypothetical protein